MTDTLGDTLPREMERVRALIPIYETLRPGSNFILIMIQADLKKAQRAITEGDLPAMIVAYKALKEYKE